MLAPAEIAPTALTRRLVGYDREQVERLLRDLRNGYEAASAERAHLEKALGRLELETAEIAALERELRETLLAAQRVVETRRREAEDEAAALVAAARSRVDAAGAALALERERAEAELERLREIERTFRAEARALVAGALARLGGVEADTRAAEPGLRPEPEPGPQPPDELAGPSSVEDDTLSFTLGPELLEQQAPSASAQPEPVETEAAEREPREGGPEPAPSELELELEPAPAVPVAEQPLVARPRARSLALSLGILVVGALVAIGIWRLAADGENAPKPPTAPPTSEAAAARAEAGAGVAATAAIAPPPTASSAEPVTETAPGEPATARLTLRAAGGDAWVLVRARSERGTLLYEGFLYDGESRRFAARRLWVRVGDPTYLVARLNGEPVRNLPPGTANLAVTAAGVRTLSLG